MIYALGNSHSHTLTDSPFSSFDAFNVCKENIFVSWSPGLQNSDYRNVTSHKFIEKSFPFIIKAIDYRKINKTTDWIILMAGEIDCRALLPKRIVTGQENFFTIIREDVEHFFQAILQLKTSGYKMIGWGIHPITPKCPKLLPTEMETFGNHLFRNAVTIVWNEHLRLMCKVNDIKFVNIFNELVNPDGTVKLEYYHDDFHLNQAVMPIIKQTLSNEGILP